VRLLDDIILTPEESMLIEALRSIEPSIERIASAGSSAARLERGGVFVKCTGIDQRIPIGSMGDGIWRLLGIAMLLVATRSGVLLIDEIDTGLHYSVMETMWKLVCKTAERLDIQVFATTHSRDCYEALAAISRADAGEDSQVSIQRIEKGKTRAVAFTEPEIVIAARRGIEVR
jgi:predicted ATPase